MIHVRALTRDERPWAAAQIADSWGETRVVSRGRVHDASALPALIAHDDDGARVGLATMTAEGASCELVTLDAFTAGQGIGTALLQGAAAYARRQGCERLWLITSNDNLRALRFYQRRGLRLVAVHRGAIDAARGLKPSIPLTGDHGIPIHDELELELRLSRGRDG